MDPRPSTHAIRLASRCSFARAVYQGSFAASFVDSVSAQRKPAIYRASARRADDATMQMTLGEKAATCNSSPPAAGCVNMQHECKRSSRSRRSGLVRRPKDPRPRPPPTVPSITRARAVSFSRGHVGQHYLSMHVLPVSYISRYTYPYTYTQKQTYRLQFLLPSHPGRSRNDVVKGAVPAAERALPSCCTLLQTISEQVCMWRAHMHTPPRPTPTANQCPLLLAPSWFGRRMQSWLSV
jgi:hypothetical protein